jgi:hypothetical protein
MAFLWIALVLDFLKKIADRTVYKWAKFRAQPLMYLDSYRAANYTLVPVVGCSLSTLARRPTQLPNLSREILYTFRKVGKLTAFWCLRFVRVTGTT